MLPSEWCRKQWDLALNDGRMKDAENYMLMFEMWKRRGM